ncbi:MAG: Omp28-related outer membrane protein [candidate division WOR-3 bacterium]
MYPGPYSGSYATPWLWVDGRQRGYNYNLWASYVAAQIGVPTPVQISLTGNYNQTTREGTIKTLIQNDSTDDLTMRVSVVVTEDSIYYSAPNGDQWHNHVCRDYIPNQYGTVITVPAGGIDSVIQPFTIASTWNEQRCKIVVYAQSTTMVPSDSSYPAYQGAEIAILDLVGVGEGKPAECMPAQVRPLTNPASGRPVFTVTASSGAQYQLYIYTVDGRISHTQNGTIAGDSRINVSSRLHRGIYLYRLKVNGTEFNGKLIVTD